MVSSIWLNWKSLICDQNLKFKLDTKDLKLSKQILLSYPLRMIKNIKK